jgi:hypothetical protein
VRTCVQRLFTLPCLENHKRLKISAQDCVAGRECYRRYCSQCYRSALSDRAQRSDRVLCVSYGFETVQDTKCDDALFEHVANLMCI